ncbi:MAG: hypothetical protein HY820_44000 [Acidobacteria bacterium]|nr:hypothetical protein [Acidobacteriota bacterium]
MKTLLKYLAPVVLTGCVCLDAAPPSDRADRSIFRYSHVPIWFDAPDDHTKYEADVLVQDMDLVDERDVKQWKAFVDRMHAQGKIVAAEMRPLTHLGKQQEYLMNDPGMQQAACVDFNLNRIKTPWMAGRAYQDLPVHFYCSNHPRYRAYLRHQIFMYVETGADAIMVDDGGGGLLASSQGGCFCQYCRIGFRDYLANKYSATQLAKLGIKDLSTFDYRDVVLRHADDPNSFRLARAKGEIPLFADFADFQTRSDADLFRSLQAMSSKLAGRHVPMGWDNVDFAGSRSLYYDFLDVFYSEINYQRFAVDGKGSDEQFPPGIVMLNKLSDALGKWHTPTPAPSSWGAIKTKNLTGLLKQWAAFSYANGGPLRYPRRGWCFGETSRWYYPPKDEFEPLYDFVRKNRVLLDDYRAVEQVGVLFTQSRGGGGDRYYRPLKHVAASLVNLNIPFGMAVAGDDQLRNRLKGNEADSFELMLVPEPARLVDGQQDIVKGWLDRKRAIAVKASDDVAAVVNGRIKPWASLDSGSGLWLFPRRIPGRKDASVVCHLVNSNYDSRLNRIVPQRAVTVSLRNALWNGAAARKVTYYTIGAAPVDLPFEKSADGVRVSIPEVDLWGILQVTSR